MPYAKYREALQAFLALSGPVLGLVAPQSEIARTIGTVLTTAGKILMYGEDALENYSSLVDRINQVNAHLRSMQAEGREPSEDEWRRLLADIEQTSRHIQQRTPHPKA